MSKNDAYGIVNELERTIRRPVNPTVMSADRWGNGTDGFVTDLRRHPPVDLIVQDAEPLPA
ncbi:hypothetical protein [Demequina zhanjiangensis]|uniref:Uncharacterized protein n=1 Tax=Demequina zhanjiangensis TaxID=3051659 RepID=A0ABT8G5A3_9MICO|nr:hypothetical protein [Demequina sp. SYSU T00b26]MDN4473899.1 hypothetical protein [Demequina sp. SYSU T00b26]